MSYSGQAALDFLASRIARDDPAASSHWRHFHSEFALRPDGSFSGVAGFGGNAPPYTGLRALIHGTLQLRYRQMGRKYRDYPRIDRLAASITRAQGRAYDLDVLRQTITLAFLEERKAALGPDAVVAVIGDGFASMTTLLLASRLARRVVLVNLDKTLLVDLAYYRRWAGKRADALMLVSEASELVEALDGDAELIAVQAENHALLQRTPIDLAINIASMQEMNPPVIAAYFEDLRAVQARRTLYFYCCNREEKRLPDGTITRFADYPWRTEDEVLVDERCPWHQDYYVTRPPGYRRYDGPARHRLLRMTPGAAHSARGNIA